MTNRSSLRLGAVGLTAALLAFSGTAVAHGQGMGYGPGITFGQGYGQGYGPGMMGQVPMMMVPGFGQGYGPGVVGQLPMMGPGFGQGYAPGMMMAPGLMMGPGMAMGMMGFGPAMGRLDADGDGLVSADEAAAHVEFVFDLLDVDGDEVLTLEEFVGGRGGMSMMTGAGHTERRRQRFAQYDADADGSVTFDELMTAGQVRYAKADADGDGKVTVWEFRMSRRR